MQVVVESVSFLDIVEADLFKIVWTSSLAKFKVGCLEFFFSRSTEMLSNSTGLKCLEIFFPLPLSYPI